MCLMDRITILTVVRFHYLTHIHSIHHLILYVKMNGFVIYCLQVYDSMMD